MKRYRVDTVKRRQVVWDDKYDKEVVEVADIFVADLLAAALNACDQALEWMDLEGVEGNRGIDEYDVFNDLGDVLLMADDLKAEQASG